MYGPKETNPDERRKYLGTLRERIEIALTKAQVMEDEIHKEVELALKNHPNLNLLLNGSNRLSLFIKYVKFG